jgi:inhibitor of KinA sporulation pathway (predicted exonuclease)
MMSNNLYIVIDFETTCWENSTPEYKERQPNQMEIIEFGAIAMTNRGRILNEFQSFVRPRMYPELTEFCTELTSITQQQVNNAEPFNLVYRRFTRWVCSVYDRWAKTQDRSLSEFRKTLTFPERIVMMSWGKFDDSQLSRDCRRIYAPNPFKKHVNLKVMFRDLFDLKTREAGLGQAVKKLDLTFVGRHHRGIDDAKMVAAVYKTMVVNHKFTLQV